MGQVLKLDFIENIFILTYDDASDTPKKSRPITNEIVAND